MSDDVCNSLFPPSKLQCQLFHFKFKTSWDKRNLNYEIYALTTLGTSWTGPNFQKFSLLPQMRKRPNYMVMMSMKLSLYKVHDPWAKGSGPRVGPILLYHGNLLNEKMTKSTCQLSPKSIKRNAKSKQSNTDL